MRLWLPVTVLALLGSPSMAQPVPEPSRPSQQMVGQLATALAASQDREADLRAQVAALQAQVAKMQPAPATPPTEPKHP